MKVLLPMHLDRWRSPIAALLRACVRFNPAIEFHSFSRPQTDEDRAEGRRFWALPNVRVRAPSALFRERFDLVHTASYSTGSFLASNVAKLRGAGHTRLLNSMNLEPRPEEQACWKRYLRLLAAVDAWVAVSETVATDLRTRVGGRFLGVIPNGFDPAYFDPGIDCSEAVPEPARAAAQGPFALWLAALEPRKHPELLVELSRRIPGTNFVAAGFAAPGHGDPFVDAFLSRPNITWLGHVDRRAVRALLRAASLLVFPSEREGLSLAVIEALGMGVPVIAQPRSSMPELIRDGVNGRLIEAGSVDEWLGAIAHYLDLPQARRDTLRTEIRAETIKRFSWEYIGPRYGPVYRAAIAQPWKLPFLDRPGAGPPAHAHRRP